MLERRRLSMLYLAITLSARKPFLPLTSIGLGIRRCVFKVRKSWIRWAIPKIRGQFWVPAALPCKDRNR